MLLMQRVADETLAFIPGAEGVLIGLARDPDWFVYVCGAGNLGARAGMKMRIDGSLAGLAVRTGETLLSADTRADARVNAEMCAEFGVLSSVCVPLTRRSQAIGVLSVSSSRTDAFAVADVASLGRLAEFVGFAISAASDLAEVTETVLSQGISDYTAAEEQFVANVLSPGALGGLRDKGRIERFVLGRGLSHVLQPIYDLESGEMMAAEALARFAGRPQRSPDEWFEEASAIGLGVPLEIASARRSMRLLPLLPPGAALCVNAGPELLTCEEAMSLFSGAEPGRVIVELTEQVRVHDYPRLTEAIAGLRSLGVRMAIDDTGAGFASLAHILKLSPDIIKLDRALTSGLDHDPVRRALAAALVTFAAETGAEIVAEGIETPQEVASLQQLGIRYGQGFFLCRPCAPQRLGDVLAIDPKSASPVAGSENGAGSSPGEEVPARPHPEHEQDDGARSCGGEAAQEVGQRGDPALAHPGEHRSEDGESAQHRPDGEGDVARHLKSSHPRRTQAKKNTASTSLVRDASS